jgi:DNA-binding NtrC family response regulator
LTRTNDSAPARILLADDQADVLEALRLLLKPEGFLIDTAGLTATALRALELKDYDVVLMDLNYTRDTTSGEEGLDLLQRIHTADESLPVVVLTAWGSVNVAVEAMRRGARDFVQKPWENERLLSIVRTQTELGRAIRRGRQLEAANQALQADGRSPILAESAAMRPVLEMIARVGPADANVLITGENGTGKSLVAQALHAVSPRAGRPMVTVNAGGMAEGVFESELFGHLKGAFTDAKTDRVGRFELADGSTLFLDEIANVPMTQQQKLLRVIETGEFERLGSSKTRKVSVRLISATNADLNQEVEAGRFRQDLYFRLNTIEIHLPPLRDRREDIPLLAKAFPPPARPALSKAPDRIRSGRHADPDGSPLARQRARDGSFRRTRRPDDARTDAALRRSRPARRRRLDIASRRHEPRGSRSVPDQEGDGALRQRQPRRPRARAVAQRTLSKAGTL